MGNEPVFEPPHTLSSHSIFICSCSSGKREIVELSWIQETFRVRCWSAGCCPCYCGSRIFSQMYINSPEETERSERAAAVARRLWPHADWIEVSMVTAEPHTKVQQSSPTQERSNPTGGTQETDGKTRRERAEDEKGV